MESSGAAVQIRVDQWRTDCCGEPFSVGDVVDWTLRQDVDRAFIARATPPEIAGRVRYAEDHHDDIDASTLDGSRRVEAVWEVRCGYGWDEVGKVSRPVAGSGALVAVPGSASTGAAGAGDRVGWAVSLASFSTSPTGQDATAGSTRPEPQSPRPVDT